MKEEQKVPEKVKTKKKQTAVGKQNQDVQMNNQGILNATHQEVPEMARTSLAELYSELKSSKRGGFFTLINSGYYRAVMSNLSNINAIMQKKFTKDTLENQRMITDMEHMYQKLIKSCDAYTARAPRTQEGIHRKELVTQIQELASSDLVALGLVQTEFGSLSPEEQSTKNWNDLLDQTRTIKLSVKDFDALGRTEGGIASEVYNLNSSNANLRDADGNEAALSDTYFFKREDEIDMSQETHAGKIVENILKRYPNLTEEEKDSVRECAANIKDKEMMIARATYLKESLDGKFSTEANKAVQSILNVLVGTYVNVNSVLPAINLNKVDENTENTEKINMSRRNVATSRVAALMGLGNLVAKSQTAEVYDKASDQTFKGNLMEKAEGISVNEFYKKGTNSGSWTDEKEIKVNATGDFQRDMCNLQVLDAICGQVDRHFGNYFVSTNEAGELAGVKGIDNDAAFGLGEEFDYKENKHARNIYDMDTGEMTIPYMDANLAERILQLEPDMFRFALKDLLKDKEIEAIIKRLKRTKKAIRNTKKTDEGQGRFLKDNEWNDDTAQEMIDQAWDMMGRFMLPKKYLTDSERKKGMGERNKTIRRQNYFGRLMIAMRKNGGEGVFGESGSAPQLERRKKRA